MTAPTELDGILAMLDSERRKVAAVLLIHRATAVRDLVGITSPDVTRCGCCFEPYPCPTAKAAIGPTP